ncbi:MAG: hypothetical protein JRG86_05450 [Deltaproteobacteria bacterium]|jgi:hypothetical protein|nr:hypothetical protein [Deltaproteobacteria bacterium]MBW2499347.1 hypothetical protein [Deltaproteobacteria bacterium]
MDITTLAAWGEFLGGIAVVVSLVYLAGQIRQNSKLLRASTTTATFQIRTRPHEMVLSDPELARIYWEGLADRSSLSEADLRRFDPLLTFYLQAESQQFLFNREGIGSPEAWEHVENALRWDFAWPGYREWFREWGHIFPSKFREYAEGLIREAEATG